MGNRSQRLRVAVCAFAFSGTLSAVVGGGLIAQTSDTATSVGNNVESGTYTPPTGIGTQMVPHGGCTASIVFSGAPLTAGLDSADIDLNDPSFSSIQPSTFCVKNTGDVAAMLSVSFAGVVGTEVGACEASERSAGDPTCADGAKGELSKVLSVAILADGGSCATASKPFANYRRPRGLTASLAPGAACGIEIEVKRNARVTDKALLQAQTDAIHWDVHLTLSHNKKKTH